LVQERWWKSVALLAGMASRTDEDNLRNIGPVRAEELSLAQDLATTLNANGPPSPVPYELQIRHPFPDTFQSFFPRTCSRLLISFALSQPILNTDR
jgi:hypothetical protein